MLNMTPLSTSLAKKIKSLNNNKVDPFLIIEKIGDLDYKCKNFSLMIPELEFMKSQNLEVVQ